MSPQTPAVQYETHYTQEPRSRMRLLGTPLPIALAVANLINLINPPLIVFGGAVVDAAQDLLLEPVMREASASTFEEAYGKTKIFRSTLGSLSAARVAALSVACAALRRAWKRVSAAIGATFLKAVDEYGAESTAPISSGSSAKAH